MSESRFVIKSSQMPDEMQQDALDCAAQGFEMYSSNRVCQ